MKDLLNAKQRLAKKNKHMEFIKDSALPFIAGFIGALLSWIILIAIKSI